MYLVSDFEHKLIGNEQKVYHPPAFVEYGDIYQLTLSTGPGINDSTLSGVFG